MSNTPSVVGGYIIVVLFWTTCLIIRQKQETINYLTLSLSCRGRHAGISAIVSLQKSTTVPPVIRVNISLVFYYKVRNFKEIEILQDEMSAISRSDNIHESKKLIYKLYKKATEQPHHFLYINLLEKNIDRMFRCCFHSYLRISDN